MSKNAASTKDFSVEDMYGSFETARLRLKPLAYGDECSTFPHIDDDLTEHWIGWEKSESVEAEKEHVEEKVRQMEAGQEMYFLAYEKITDELVGECGLETDSADQSDKGIVIWVRKEMRNRGYAMEMLHGLLAVVRQHTRLPHLVYSVTEGNVASKTIAVKLAGIPFRTFEALKRGERRIVTNYRIRLKP